MASSVLTAPLAHGGRAAAATLGAGAAAVAVAARGDIAVEVTLSQSRIESVKVLKHAETDGIGSKAVAAAIERRA